MSEQEKPKGDETIKNAKDAKDYHCFEQLQCLAVEVNITRLYLEFQIIFYSQ